MRCINIPIENFEGTTWIAYMDISGFKKFMHENNGLHVLNKFMDDAYQELGATQNFDGIFFSDSGVVFYRQQIPKNNDEVIFRVLNELLSLIRRLNTRYMTPSSKWEDVSFLTKCCVAFGEFKFQNKEEHIHILKGPIYGRAYVKAFLSIEKNKPHKMEIGEVRIMYYNLKKEFSSKFKKNTEYDEFKHLYQFSNDHMYYSWTYRDNPNNLLNRIREEAVKSMQEYNRKRKQKIFKDQKELYKEWIC